MICKSYLANGNVKHKVPLKEVKRVILTDVDVSFTGLSDVYNLATWKEKINVDLDMYVTRGKTSYEVTTDDPNVLTTQASQKMVTNQPAPSALVYLDSNWDDYKDVLDSFRGGTYGVIYELMDGSIFLKRHGDGTFKPFPARLTAVNKGIPVPGDIANNFPLHIHHFDYDDFRKGVLIAPAWDFEELVLAMPVGLTIEATSTMSTGSINVLITERCGDGKTGLVVGDFEVLDSNYLTSPEVTVASDDGAGNYELTIQKNSPAENLADGDYVTIRVNVGGGTLTTYLSNRLTVLGTGA